VRLADYLIRNLLRRTVTWM